MAATPTALTRGEPVTAGRPARLGFRPTSRSLIRIVLGVLLSLIAIGAVLLVFTTMDKRAPVLQLVRDVPAGQQLTADDVRPIELSVDPTLEIVSLADEQAVVGRYAKVRMVSGQLLAHPLLQDRPLVGPTSSVIALMMPSGALPLGLRERSHVLLVFPPQTGEDKPPPLPVEGHIVGLPTAVDELTGSVSISVEVARASAAIVAGAAQVRVVLLDPQADPGELDTPKGTAP